MAFLLRFLIGGLFVSTLAVFADALKPKSFAGLFGAAPSVALASLILTIRHNGIGYAALESRSMIAGALAFFVYALVCVQLIARLRWRVLTAAIAASPLWFFCAFGLWLLFLK